MKLYLKIDDTWVEPDVNKADADVLALNWAFDTLQNPTDYISEYSYDLTLPKSARNNKMFDEYYPLDSTIKYKPNDTIEYIYISEGDTISNGRCYLKEITREEYVLALNGSLNIIFNQLLDSGWDENVDPATNDDYQLLDDPLKFRNGLLTTYPTFSPTLVRQCWENFETIPFNMPAVRTLNNNALNYIGFLPANGNKYEDFETKKMISSNGTVTELDGNTDGIDEHAMAEFRIGEQHPYVWVQRLWKIYQDQCKSLTGYEMKLDGRWFSDSYEYLKGLVYVLPKMDLDGAGKNEPTTDTFDGNVDIPKVYAGWYNGHQFTFSHDERLTSDGTGIFSWDIPVRFDVTPQTGSIVWPSYWQSDKMIFSPYSYVYFKVRVTDGTRDYYSKRYGYAPLSDIKHEKGDNTSDYILPTPNSQFYLQPLDEAKVARYTKESAYFSDENKIEMTFGHCTGTVTVSAPANAYMVIEDLQIKHLSGGTYDTDFPTVVVREDSDGTASFITPTINSWKDMQWVVSVTTQQELAPGWSEGGKLTMAKVFGTLSPFSILIKHAKMLGLVWLVDDYAKTIRVLRRADYVYDCFHTDMSAKTPSIYPYTGYFDATGLADFTDYTVKPLAWSSRRVEMNFTESDNDYAKDYEDKYGKSYGGVTILTGNRTTNETEQLLGTSDYNKIAPTILTEEYVTPYKVAVGGSATKIKDDPYIQSIANCFAYRLPNGTFTSELRGGWRMDGDSAQVLLSMSTDQEKTDKERYWHADGITGDVLTTVRPVFSDTNTNGFSVLFAEPYEVYSDRGVNIKYLYAQEWADYIEEVYNTDNKTLTLNADINGQLYNRLKICPFLAIGNIGYLVTQIDDWTDGNLTRVVLRQITDIKKMERKAKTLYSRTLRLTDNELVLTDLNGVEIERLPVPKD